MSKPLTAKQKLKRGAEEMALSYWKPHGRGDETSWYLACVKMAEDLIRIRAAADGMQTTLLGFNDIGDCKAFRQMKDASLKAYKKAVKK